jgi:HEAT repeat protein
MLQLAEQFVDILVPLLFIGFALLAARLVALIAQRGARALFDRRRATIERRYREAVDLLLQPRRSPDAATVLLSAPRRDRRLIGAVLLAPLQVATGEIISSVRYAATLIDLPRLWRDDLRSARWWRRADAVRALGLIRDGSAYDDVVRLIDDDHEEVRAAAIEALGLVGDVRALPALLRALSDASRYQRARVVEALGRLGEDAVRPLAAFAATHPRDTEVVAEVLGHIGGAAAVDDLLRWTASELTAVRVAAFRALGTIGLDDRSHYHALKGLTDPSPEVRAMAARALGRAGRADAARYIAALLDDEWIAAAHAARALRRLGVHGSRALEARARDAGLPGDLARQMLWERGLAAGGPA